MRILNEIAGAVVEAWGEVKVQKARVILSLVGVVAAVTAMTTVIALGDLTVQSNMERMEAADGREVTLHVSVSQNSSDQQGNSPTEVTSADSQRNEGEHAAGNEGTLPPPDGKIHDPIGHAMETVAQRFAIPYWSRSVGSSVDFTEVQRANQSGQFRGRPVVKNEYGYQPTTVTAVDPNYQVIFRTVLSQGRWISPSDADQRVTPIVINTILWDMLGRSPIEDPIILHGTDPQATPFRVVGIIEAKSKWESPSMYVDYTAWQYVKSEMSSHSDAGGGMGIEGHAYGGYTGPETEMLVWVGPEQEEEARRIIPQAVSAVLGEGWTASVYGGDGWDGGREELRAASQIIMVIGGIVIFLGALGLLNVAIVTVRQRIREIGIRRAMGASATRVFFAVFMESVVATFVAGVLGVAMAAIILRFLPLENMDIVLQDMPAFPVGAALTGVGIATAIGALCGIIPAVAAIRVKPIDAIRY
ncbi:ABC transporter permease [Schaalia sp. ZJ1691]|uniref:ABC transporter permease n=1 Tax=Schaalia sp. ZJ1691 TaxID=2709404 RepID=UPI0013EAA65B|nr:ABC transporter permease [Schaalia sp. ZJ1691]